MSKLRSRLDRRLGGSRQESAESPATGESTLEEPSSPRSQVIEQLRDRMNKIAARHALRASADAERTDGNDGEPVVVPSVDRRLPGAVFDTSMGEVWINRQDFDGDHCHGDVPLAGFLNSGTGLAALCRDERIASLDPMGALFVDTETTGLSGGTGTLPFLVGVAWFNEDRTFTVEHIFCREPDEEPAQLERLAAHFSRSTHLVSFNGRSFDMPLLNTRFILNRTRNPATGIPHLDLLHVCRRIFSRRLTDRSLKNLEEVILNFRRVDDIPGSEIPAVYGDFLRGGPASSIISVLEHNSMDLLALAALGGVLEKMYTDPEAVAYAADHLGLARSAFHAGQGARGFDHLNRADVTGEGSDRQDALHLLAKQSARRSDFVTAEKTWLQIIALFPDDAAAHLALAKHFERRAKDYPRALIHAHRTAEAEGEDGSAHRIARLQKKIGR